VELIDWRFSNSNGQGTRCISVGLGASAGVPFAPVDQLVYNDVDVDSGDSFTWTQELDVPSGMVNAMLVLHFTVDVPDADLNLTTGLDVRFNGETIDFHAVYANNDDPFVIECLAYVYVGDGSELADPTVEFDMSAAGYVGTCHLSSSVFWFNGMDDAAGVFEDAGTVNVFTSPLELDPSPSPDYDVVITGACQSLADATSSTLAIATDDYTEATEDQGTENSVGNVAWFFCDVSYNCECDTDPNAKTLLELRQEVLLLTGYAAQVDNPPPGIPELYNGYCDTAQKYLYRKYRQLQTERFFSWVLRPGIRYYGIRANRDCCTVYLNPEKITGAWIQDLNNVWWPLTYGIDPTFYTLDSNFGWPAYFEVRQCVEVFPAPQAAYTLRIKGRFDLLPFTEDDDTTTIHADLVKNWAIYLAKAAKGQRDANLYQQMAIEGVADAIAGAHVTRRYIPGTAEVPVPTPPTMVRFET
jgi:hypothetical protein